MQNQKTKPVEADIVNSLQLIIETISPHRFSIIKVAQTEDGLRVYIKPSSIDVKFLETDALVYDLIWHVENSYRP